jgi:hypothetical protein
MKEVQIRRREAKSDLPPAVVSSSKKVLASIYDGQGPLRGVTGSEEKKLLSQYLGIDVEDTRFPKIVRDFWADLRVEVPIEGKVLNIGKDEDGSPLDIEAYLIYQWALKHKFVAPNKSKMLENSLKQYYIFDPDFESKQTNQEVEYKRKAYAEFIKISGNEEKIDMIIMILTNSEPNKMSSVQKDNYLDQLIAEDPKRFVEVATDKAIEIKFNLAMMVSNSILTKIGNQYWFMDQKLGNTEEEAVLFFKDKKNSETVNILKAKLEEAKR